METSAAVPTRTELAERGLAELSDEDIEHLADLMTRVWRHENRISLLSVFLPFGGCTVLVAVGGETLFATAMALGGLGLLAGAFAAGIANVLFRRSLSLEVESLGYDELVARAVSKAWQRAIRSFLPRITRQQKRDACKKQLQLARAHALPSR